MYREHASCLLRQGHRGRGGFTLIELLIVMALVGVIAAVVILNVINFSGSGNLQAAKTELHQAQTAIGSCMSDAGESSLDSSASAWDGSQGVVKCGNYDAADYLYGKFKATYDVGKDGTIKQGYPGSWSGITWDNATGTWNSS